jgi:alkylhydroperoxidase family enzyme
VSEGLRATLGFVEKLTLTPEQVTADDAAQVLAAGVSAPALLDAIYVCALFNLMDRVADALGFEIPVSFTAGAASQLKRGYKM